MLNLTFRVLATALLALAVVPQVDAQTQVAAPNDKARPSEPPNLIDPFAARANRFSQQPQVDPDVSEFVENATGKIAPRRSSPDAPRVDAVVLKDGTRLEGVLQRLSYSDGARIVVDGQELRVELSQIERVDLSVSETFALAVDAFESGVRAALVRSFGSRSRSSERLAPAPTGASKRSGRPLRSSKRSWRLDSRTTPRSNSSSCVGSTRTRRSFRRFLCAGATSVPRTPTLSRNAARKTPPPNGSIRTRTPLASRIQQRGSLPPRFCCSRRNVSSTRFRLSIIFVRSSRPRARRPTLRRRVASFRYSRSRRTGALKFFNRPIGGPSIVGDELSNSCRIPQACPPTLRARRRARRRFRARQYFMIASCSGDRGTSRRFP